MAVRENSSSHLSADQIDRFRANQLDPSELAQVGLHASVCSECRFALKGDTAAAAGKRMLAMLSIHLTEGELAAIADGTADARERERIEAHARSCEDCAIELDVYHDMAKLRNRPQPRAKSQPNPTPVGGWRSWFPFPRLQWTAAALAVSAAAVLFLLVRPSANQHVTEQAATDDRQMRTPGPAAPAPAAVLRDGTELVYLAENGAVTSGLDHIPAPLRDSVREMLRTRQLLVAVPPDVRTRSGTLMSQGKLADGDTVILLEPKSVVLETDRPHFRWSAPDAEQARVSIVDVQRDYEPVAESDWLTGNDWESAQRLQRGRLYAWQVTVQRAGKQYVHPLPEHAEARFRILAANDFGRLQQLRASDRTTPLQ
jgi:anti-sigma factor RsiW